MKARKLETRAPCVANRAESLYRELVEERHVSLANPLLDTANFCFKLLNIFNLVVKYG